MKKSLFIIALACLMTFTACKKDKENQGEAQFTATTEHQGGRTSLNPNNGNITWTSGDQIVIANDNDETSVFTLQSGEGTTEGGFGTSDEFNTVGPFIAAYPTDAVIGNDKVTFNLPATQAIENTETFAIGANPMVACSDDKNLQFKNLCGGLGIRLKGVGAHVSAVRITSKNTSEKLWGAFEVSNCAANEPTLTEASGNQGSNVITLTCDVTLTTAAKTFFVMLPPGTLANGFTMEVLDGNEVLTTKETTSDIAMVERNSVKCFNEILIDVEFDGNVEIPAGMSSSDIIVTNFGEDAIPDENGDFAIGYSKMLVAKNADNGKVIYYSLYSIESGSKNEIENDYEIGARETAIFFAVRLFPFYLKDGYDDVLLKVKESLSTLPCVTELETAIRNTVATYGYLKEDEIAPAVHNVSDFFYDEFMSVQTSMPETKDEPSQAKLDPPYFSPNHRHGVWLNMEESHFLENPQRWSINCTGYSSQFCALGLVEGYLNENNLFIKREGSIPYYMPPMGMSQYAKLAESVAFMTLPGNWAGLLQLYRKVKQAINDPDYLLELTHVTYENMTFEVPRTANAIGVLTPMDDETVAVWTAVYMAYDVFSLIPTVGAYPIESIANAYLQDGDFVNLVRTQRNNGEEGWSMIVEAMVDRIDEISLAIAPQIPLDIINSLTPIGTVCSGLDLFLAAITWGTLNTFALPVVTGFPTMELPTLATLSVQNITGTTAQVKGRILSTGSHSILERGVCYSTSPEPTYDDNYVEAALPTDVFICSLVDLEPLTRYYVRAYAINELGYISYGNEISLTTLLVPTVTTLEVTDVATASAKAHAHVTHPNMSQITEMGFLYDTSTEGLWYGDVGSEAVVFEGSPQNDFTCTMTGLYPYTEYFVRAYAKTANGIGYGDIVSFTTHTEVPIITTYPVDDTDITSTSAVFRGKVENLSSNLVMTRGFLYNTSPQVYIEQPGVINVDAPEGGTGEFSVTATGLTPNTTYYYLAYIWMSYPGTDEVEIFHGPEKSFTTLSGGGPFVISVSANPSNGGMVSGGGAYNQGQSCTVSATANSGYTFVNWTENGTTVSTDANYTFMVSGDRTLVANFTVNGGGGNGSYNGHDYVDLGLPSGTLWATCNVGAETPEEYGDYFAWGEIQSKSWYALNTYRFLFYGKYTRYCHNPSDGYNGYTDTLTVLLSGDDAATAIWGEGWRMPTKTEWEELLQNTVQQEVDLYHPGDQPGDDLPYGKVYLFIASNGNSICLPAAGYRFDVYSADENDHGFYWSCSFVDDSWTCDAWGFKCDIWSGSSVVHSPRDEGLSVRPVRSAR